ncbi:unnamed protein product, partial [Closterium sp. NIES-54]
RRSRVRIPMCALRATQREGGVRGPLRAAAAAAHAATVALCPAEQRCPAPTEPQCPTAAPTPTATAAATTAAVARAATAGTTAATALACALLFTYSTGLHSHYSSRYYCPCAAASDCHCLSWPLSR